MKITTSDKALLRALYDLQIEQGNRASIPPSEIEAKLREKYPDEFEASIDLDLLFNERFGLVERVGDEWALTQVGAMAARQLEW